MAIIAAFPGGGGGKVCSGVTTGTASALTLTYTGFKLEDGAEVRFRLHVDSTGSATLNVNSTGVKTIKTSWGDAFPSGIVTGTWLTVIYSSVLDCYVLQGVDVNPAGKVNKSGDTMTGKLVAQANANYTTYQVRNIALSTSAATPTGLGSLLGVYS